MKETLKRSLLCAGLSEGDLEKLCGILSANAFIKKIDAQETLMPIGIVSDYIYLLEEGLVRTVNYTNAGEEISFFYFKEGDFVGLINTIAEEKCYSEYVAVKASSAYAIPVDDFRGSMDAILPFQKNILKAVSHKSLDLIQLVVISRRKRTRDRICSYLYMEYEKNNDSTYRTPFTIELLARRLNLTRSALSKELHAMEEEGLVKISKNRIYLPDPEKLKDYLFHD